MSELKGKGFESPDARLFLAITHLVADGAMRLCPHYSGLEPGAISSVWGDAGMGTPPGHSQESCGERVGWDRYLFQIVSLNNRILLPNNEYDNT